MALTKIEYGSLASSDVMNNNFDYLDNRITTITESMTSNNAGIYSNIASTNSLLSRTSYIIRPIGQPILRLDNTLLEDEIRLEGAEISKTTYSELYAVYGNTYGTAENTDNFLLPDFRGRVFWGSEDLGYMDAGLPNITGTITKLVTYAGAASGVFAFTSTSTWKKDGTDQVLYHSTMNIDASRSSSIYGKTDTVRPPSVQIRVVTRYK